MEVDKVLIQDLRDIFKEKWDKRRPPISPTKGQAYTIVPVLGQPEMHVPGGPVPVPSTRALVPEEDSTQSSSEGTK